MTDYTDALIGHQSVVVGRPITEDQGLTERLRHYRGRGMHVTERVVGDVTIVDVSGKVTLGDGGDVVLKDKMASLVQQGTKKVLLNLADVSYVDSAGLGAIVQSYATLNKSGGSLKLLNVTKRIRDLLSITKLLTVFECLDNEAEAVKSFGASV
jgi:anti-sigma B factor antagonist